MSSNVNKTSIRTCASNDGSNQPAHRRSLIKVFAWRKFAPSAIPNTPSEDSDQSAGMRHLDYWVKDHYKRAITVARFITELLPFFWAYKTLDDYNDRCKNHIKMEELLIFSNLYCCPNDLFDENFMLYSVVPPDSIIAQVRPSAIWSNQNSSTNITALRWLCVLWRGDVNSNI